MKLLKKRKKPSQKTLTALLAALSIVIIALIITNIHLMSQIFYFKTLLATGTQITIPTMGITPAISLVGFTRVEVTTEPGIIYLTSGCSQLPMTTSETQTYSIQTGLENNIEFRPTAHDVVRDVLENFGIEPLMAKVEKLEDNTYFAKLILQRGNLVLALDSKPSDAIAVAVRFNVPIYIKDELLQIYGQRIC